MSDSALRLIDAPAAVDVPADLVDFLRALGGPTLIRIPGEDEPRLRALSVLVHGNETSGARALHRLLREGQRPRASLLCFVGAVEAALGEPLLTHRHVPGQRDLNRCFRGPFDDAPGRVALALRTALAEARPECLVDIHNTSAPSPAFAVAPHEDTAHEALAGLFCSNLVITDLALGALMETSGDPCPAITVECGAAAAPAADAIAWNGLQRYLQQSGPLRAVPGRAQMEVFHHPARLEFAPGTRLAWGIAPVPGADFTVRSDLERFNFATLGPHEPIGWLGPRGLAMLCLRDGRGVDLRAAWLRSAGGCLYPRQVLRLFMVTSTATMALGDCLLYAAPEREHTRTA